MTDFLNELAAKNLGTAHVIVPRRAALFESATAHPHFQPVTEPESISIFEKVNLGESSPNTTRRKSKTAEQDALTSSAADLFPKPTSARTLREFEAGPPSPRISPTSRNIDAEEERGQRLFRPAPVATAGSAPTDQPKADRPFVQPTLRQTPESAPLTADKSEPRKKDRQSAPAQSRITATPRIVISEDHDRKGTDSRMPLDLAPKSSDDAAEKSEVPIINVTIGRVEVRALPSPAPTRTLNAKSPTLSLDEYLQRRRNGGAR